jgi:hypothetical protein
MKLALPLLAATCLAFAPADFALAQVRPAPAPVVALPSVPDYSDADARAVLNARLAALKAVLDLTPAQESLWPPVEAAIRGIVREASERRAQRMTAAAPTSFLDVLGMIADAEEARGRALRRLVDAARPLNTALTEQQRRRVPAFVGMTDHPGPGQPSAQLWIFEEEEG